MDCNNVTITLSCSHYFLELNIHISVNLLPSGNCLMTKDTLNTKCRNIRLCPQNSTSNSICQACLLVFLMALYICCAIFAKMSCFKLFFNSCTYNFILKTEQIGGICQSYTHWSVDLSKIPFNNVTKRGALNSKELIHSNWVFSHNYLNLFAKLWGSVHFFQLSL